jgi:hypothetical protein
MFLNILLLILTIISFFQRKNVPLAKFQSEFAASVFVEFGEILVESIIYLYI